MSLNFKKHPSWKVSKSINVGNINTIKPRATTVGAASCLPSHLAYHHSKGAQVEQDMNMST